jgi:hypothetical protein
LVTYFQALGSGVGDVLVCKPAFEWLAANSSEPVVFVARGPRQVGLSILLEGAHGEVDELNLPRLFKPGDKLVNLRDHELQTAHDWFSPDFKVRFGHMKVAEILNEICASKGILANNREIKPLQFSPDRRSRDKVILSPATTCKSKQLESKFWLELADRLRQLSIDTIVLGVLHYSAQIQDLVRAGFTHIETEKLQEAVNLISCARAMISVDTGLMHIGVQQSVNTIAIFGACEVYYRPSPHCFPIFTDKRSCDPASEYKTYNFSTTYHNWDYLPPEAESGDFLDFEDYDRIIDLLQQCVQVQPR